MIKDIFIIIFGIVFLVLGANQLIKGASNIAKKMNISNIIIGLTIVSLGTSLPELIVTIISATKGTTELIIGNILGSNVCNLLLVLGIMAIIKPVEIDEKTRKIHIPILIISTILVFIMALGIFVGEKLKIVRLDGIILFLVGILYFAYTIYEGLKNKDISQIQDEKSKSNLIYSVINILLGSMLLKYGGDFVVDASISIATKLKISERVIGLTIIGIGTSLPELTTSIIALIKHDDEIAVGNIIGSCIMNLLLILGTGAIISTLDFGYSFNQTMFLLIASTILIWLYSMAEENKKLNRHNGIVLIAIFMLYFFKLFI